MRQQACRLVGSLLVCGNDGIDSVVEVVFVQDASRCPGVHGAYVKKKAPYGVGIFVGGCGAKVMRHVRLAQVDLPRAICREDGHVVDRLSCKRRVRIAHIRRETGKGGDLPDPMDGRVYPQVAAPRMLISLVGIALPRLDFQLLIAKGKRHRGCPVSAEQLIDVFSHFLLSHCHDNGLAVIVDTQLIVGRFY